MCTPLKELHGTFSKKPLISFLPLVTLLVNEKVESNTNMIFVCPKLSNFYFCFVAPKYDIQTLYNLQRSEIYLSFSFDLTSYLSVFVYFFLTEELCYFLLIVKGDGPGCITFNSQGILFVYNFPVKFLRSSSLIQNLK